MEAAWTPAPYSLPLDDLYANDPPHRFLHNDIVYIGVLRLGLASEGIYMKLSVDSLHQCDGFVLFCQTFSEDLSCGVSFS